MEKKTKKAKTRKRKTRKKGSEILVGPDMRDGLLHFSKEDLMVYELAQYKVANASQSIRLKMAEIENVKRAMSEKINTLSQDIADLTKYVEEEKNKLKALQEEIEKVYNVDMKEITYDDVTGRIYRIGEGKDS